MRVIFPLHLIQQKFFVYAFLAVLKFKLPHLLYKGAARFIKHSLDLQCKSNDWFLYESNTTLKWVK